MEIHEPDLLAEIAGHIDVGNTSRASCAERRARVRSRAG
jgi:hypothetical protein